jgi:RimJ/RimL family protein N-acetyltransferase
LSPTTKSPGYGAWPIVDRSLDQIVGAVILQPLETSGLIEVGWHLARRFWGQGYATESGRACMRFALTN